LTDPIQALLDAGVTEGDFPAAQASVWHKGKPVFRGSAGGVSRDTPFDLASLTKAICTVPLFLRAWTEGAVNPETPLALFHPGTPAADAGVTLGQLLSHTSGLPTWLPLFSEPIQRLPDLLSLDCNSATRFAVRAQLVEAVARTPLETPPEGAQAYGDLGFLLLGEILVKVAGKPLDALFDTRVRAPLGLAAHFHRLSGKGHDPRDPCAGMWEDLPPTGQVRPRPPAPGQGYDWAGIEPVPARPGEVDDDNAWILDGVAGHAGLFGSAEDVARFGQAALEELSGAGLIAPARLWERAVSAMPGGLYGLGYDTPSPYGSRPRTHLGNSPPGAFGHLGFTGTSFWVDRGRELVVSLVTNRTAKGRDNVGIQAFRPRFHDRVVVALGLE
jgi:CubicO group peptidase (beta-lactamase class C family)